ncbi:MAG: hypothetical protein WA005_10520 [Candidatus Binataceae bacterium]
MSGSRQLTEFNKLEWGAIWLFLYQHAVPLIVEKDEEQFIHGTGSFFRSKSGKIFMITAAHVFQGIDPNNLGIPLGPYRTGCSTLGPGTIHSTAKTEVSDVDIAVFPVTASEILEKMEWECLTARNVAALRPMSVMNEFLIFGYPDCRVKSVAG